MRSGIVLSIAMFSATFLQFACTSTGGSSDGLSYDGSAEVMDSLPDCGAETLGSLFWVREKNMAFECGKSNQWSQRKNAKKPEEVIEEERSEGDRGAVSPRIVK